MPTETYNIPNHQKFYEDFGGLFRFDVAAFFGWEIPVFPRPLFMHIELYHVKS